MTLDRLQIVLSIYPNFKQYGILQLDSTHWLDLQLEHDVCQDHKSFQDICESRNGISKQSWFKFHILLLPQLKQRHWWVNIERWAGSSEQQKFFITYSMSHNQILYEYFHTMWIHFLWHGKTFLVDTQNILSCGQGFGFKT